jgi:hypothetical protein
VVPLFRDKNTGDEEMSADPNKAYDMIDVENFEMAQELRALKARLFTKRRAQSLVNRLIDVAYDSGYYSGRNQDGMPHHLAAIRERETLRREVIAALTGEG